ncbi:ATP-binding protein [Cohaesibacter intestini]|uniref:ATP-binding protein n=1 Tax=Cohaesibacter intestini TaxID=2211145 RepID=UPI000DEAD1C2|nr:ATP-binding protein [Cohaesibacter intestini]
MINKKQPTTKSDDKKRPSPARSFRLWPSSLAGQLVAALMIALVVAQAVTILLFAYERSNIAVTTTRGQVLDRTASVVRLLNETDESLHQRVIRAAEGPDILFTLRDKTSLLVPRSGTKESFLVRRLERRAGLEEGTVRISDLPRKLTFNKSDPQSRNDDAVQTDDRWRKWKEERDEARKRGFEAWKQRHDDRMRDRNWRDRRPKLAALDMTLAVPLNSGKWLQVRTGLPKPPEKWGRPFLISLVTTASFIFLVVIFTVRRLTAPLRDLENASRKLGRGETIEPLAEKGPKEVRGTIIAFNAMQERLMRFVQDRTRMLAAVSHDLRTPITTLRLRAEFIDDEEMRGKVLETLEEMQAMTEAVLAFAREDATSEETREVDIAAMLSSMVDDYQEMGKDVRFEGPDSLIQLCRAVSLKRAMRNLTENALRYAGDATVQLAKTATGLRIDVCDRGPGIPEDKLEEVFSPFFRVEGSRNLETGGVGLGLSITRTIIRSHGGDITLTNRSGGGLKATIQLPR